MVMAKKSVAGKWLRVLLPSVLVVVWLALAGYGGQHFANISEESSTDLTTFLPENSDATKVNKRLDEFSDKKSIPLVIVYDNDGVELTNNDLITITKASDSLADVEQVTGKIPAPIESDDKQAAITVVPLESDGDFKTSFKTIRHKLDESNLSVNYTLTGTASFARDLQDAFSGIDSTLLFVALSVVFVILLIVYRSPMLPFIVLSSAMVALSVAVWIVVELARADIVQLNGQVQGILFILVIGAATDYSLLYVARFREELVDHRDKWHATWAALKSSYEPIIAAGATVSIGLMCLLLSDLGSNRALGPVGGMGIVLSVLVTLTLLPSLLLLMGRSVYWPRKPKYTAGKAEQHYISNHPAWSKVGALVRQYPRRIWAASVALLLVACIGVFQLRAEGVSQSNLVLGESEAVKGGDILDEHFAGGSGSPALIIVGNDVRKEAVETIEDDKGVSSVSIVVSGLDMSAMPVGKLADDVYSKIREEIVKSRDKKLDEIRSGIEQQMAGYPEQYVDAAYESAIANIPSVKELVKKADPFKGAKINTSNGQVLLNVTLTDPADSLVARETVQRLRDKLNAIDSDSLVGGTSATQLDTNQSSLRDIRVVIPAILVAITIILMMLLRSIVAPLILLITTVLSFGATLGISALVFNNLWNFPGADPSVIIFGFVFLVALGIDYNIFLMTRVREETLKSGVSKGTIKGLVVTGGVISSAGIVLAATFSALSVIPILFLVQIAFIVAFGVLLDTIIVRSLLVPALTLEVGLPMWWPSKLSKKK